jgi:hypothetical protein
MEKTFLKNNAGIYVILFAGFLLLAWSAVSVLKTNPSDNDSLKYSPENHAYYEAKALESGSECGDLTDEKNVQHLSHHPSRYADCLKQVDPALLQKASGKTLQEILGA